MHCLLYQLVCQRRILICLHIPYVKCLPSSVSHLSCCHYRRSFAECPLSWEDAFGMDFHCFAIFTSHKTYFHTHPLALSKHFALTHDLRINDFYLFYFIIYTTSYFSFKCTRFLFFYTYTLLLFTLNHNFVFNYAQFIFI